MELENVGRYCCPRLYSRVSYDFNTDYCIFHSFCTAAFQDNIKSVIPQVVEMLKNPHRGVQISAQRLLSDPTLSRLRPARDALEGQGDQVRRNIHSADIVNEQLPELDHASPGILQASSMHRRDGENMKLSIKHTLEDGDNDEGLDRTAMDHLPQRRRKS